MSKPPTSPPAAPLARLFDPAKIAVIGASANPDRVGHIVFRGLIRSKRELFPVHPREKILLGYRVYQDIASLPTGIDIAVVTVSAESAVEAALECAAAGIPFVIVIAGGFGETGEAGRSLERLLKEIPGRTGTRILGPNSLGIFLPDLDLDTIFVEHGDRALARGGGVAFITQSGSVGVEALGFASNTGFGLRAFVGLGNKADLDELDFLEYFSADPHTTCIALYLESVERGRDFLEAAREAAKTKPVVILKAGKTLAGARAAGSHTGRLAGNDRVFDGAFQQYRIHRATDDEELCDVAKTLSLLAPVKRGRVAILTPAGGYGVMCADYVASPGNSRYLSLAELSETTKDRIRAASFPFASCDNPVDVSASADDDMVSACLEAMIEDGDVDIVVYIAFFAPPGITENLVGKIAALSIRSGKPILAFTQYGPFTDRYLSLMYQAGIVGFPSLARTVRAARFLVERGRYLELLRSGR